jgi:hypothetical protein
MTFFRQLRSTSLVVIALVLASAAPASSQEGGSDLELAKESQNPIGNIISVPIENNIDFDVGPEDALLNTLSFKPVYPVNLGDWNLINRAIVPVIYQQERFPGEGEEFGLGDSTYQAYFSPAAKSPVIWGAGPAIVLPTHTANRLGTDRVSMGPSAVALMKPGRWLFGALAQNVWSVAGGDSEDVNVFSFQYFVNYNFDSGWYLSSTPTIVANWEADSDNRWTVPFGLGLGKLVRIGGAPVDLKAQGFWNAERPENSAEWALELRVKFLFPK